MEDRFWALFEKDDKGKEEVKKMESFRSWSSWRAPVHGSAAMFLAHVMDKFWVANPSGSLSALGDTDAIEVAELGQAIASAVTACSSPSATVRQCDDAILSAKKPRSKTATQFILGCIDGMPQLKRWIDDEIPLMVKA